MKRFLLLLITVFLSSFEANAQCTITGTSVNTTSYPCSSFTGCTVLYIGDGTNPTNLVMTANWDLTCLGAIQFIVRNNANIDFSVNNYNLNLAANSTITVESGGNVSAASNCSASDLIYIGTVKVASCNGGGGADTDFPGLVSGGGYNVVSASATTVCGSGTSVITATMYPAPTSSTTYKWYTVASGGTPFLTSNATSNPYTASYTTGTLSSTTTYYVEATRGSITAPRRAVVVTVVPTTAPTVSLTQPTCSVSTGTITISSPTGSGYTYSTNGSTYTNTTGVFSSVAAGTYSVTARTLGCTTSGTSATINAQPSTPATPTRSAIVQPTCAVQNGTFTITNYNAAYTYSASPSTGVSFSGSTVSAPSGTYAITATSGSCTSSALNVTMNAIATDTWTASGWSTGSAPTSTQKIVFAHDYSSSGNLTGCACLVSSGNVVINSGHTLSITNDVKVTAGSLTFEDTASLVQTNDVAVNSGNITYKRKTAPLKQYDYTYWSSPVVGATLSQLATNSLLYSFNQYTNHWLFQTGASTMTQGVGYIGRAPNNLTYSPTQIVETSFVGVPANGIINTPIIKDASTYSLIGNPYPSAIDVDLFITANTAVTNGTVYFWTHNTALTNYVYTINDYAKYNLTGSTRTSTTAVGGSVFPTGKIAAGQGFFIEAKTSLANGTYSAVFNDAMRISANNTQFFKTSASAPVVNSISEALERHRIWLSLSNPQGAYSQMLLGYVEGATNDFDSLFDGKTLPAGNPVTIYTTVGTDNLAIQGKSLPFSEADVVPVAYNTTINGEMTITLDDYDGLFTTHNVYLLDKITNTLHDIKSGPYTFITTNGTFTDRFELRYTETALGTNAPTVTVNDIKIIAANNHLEVLSPATAIAKIQVYDILGKLLFAQNEINANLFRTDLLHITPQILLVKVTLDNQSSFTKKVLMQ